MIMPHFPPYFTPPQLSVALTISPISPLIHLNSPNFLSPFLAMEDFLASMWSSLSLTKNEAATLEIDPKKLSVPKNVLVGKLAMKKHASLFKVDKGLKIIWDAASDLETTILGENLYLFTFKSDRVVNRILKNQPWNFRGSLVILGRIQGEECPSELVLHSVPFWV